MSMHEINTIEAEEFINHVAFRNKLPIMLWGQPGVGKSQVVAQVTDENTGALVDIRLSQYDSVDLRGLPDRDNGVTVWNMPSTIPFAGNPRFAHISPDTPIVLFLDELNSAALSVQAVAYQLINDRAVGEHKLMDNVIVIAAGNRESDRGVTNKMPLPLANRLTHVEVGPDIKSLSRYFTKIGIPDVCVGFLNFRKNLISTFDPSKPDKAFATPRTWERAFRLFADTLMPASIKRSAIAGTVGEGNSLEFFGFIEVYDQVKGFTKKVLANPESADLPKEGSHAYACAVCISGEMDKNTVKPFSIYLNRLSQELCVMAWQMALTRDKALFATDEYLAFSKKFAAMLK